MVFCTVCEGICFCCLSLRIRSRLVASVFSFQSLSLHVCQRRNVFCVPQVLSDIPGQTCTHLWCFGMLCIVKRLLCNNLLRVLTEFVSSILSQGNVTEWAIISSKRASIYTVSVKSIIFACQCLAEESRWSESTHLFCLSIVCISRVCFSVKVTCLLTTEISLHIREQNVP